MSSDIFHELNPVLVAQVDAFAEMLEQRNLARDAAVCLEQELAAAEAENKAMREVTRMLFESLNAQGEGSDTCDCGNCDAPECVALRLAVAVDIAQHNRGAL